MDGIRSKGPLRFLTERLFDEVPETAPAEVPRGLESGSSCGFLQSGGPNCGFRPEVAERQISKSQPTIA